MYFMYLQLNCKIRVFIYSATVTCRIVVCKSSHLLVITSTSADKHLNIPVQICFLLITSHVLLRAELIRVT